jgi:membrane protein DedA with SNARE-associated domain
MWDEVVKAIPVYLFSMLKFIFGPVGGYLAGLSLTTTILVTVAGMMTMVVAFAYFGDFLRHKVLSRLPIRRKKFSDRSRRFVRFWRRYGLAGVAFFTPVILTPIFGTILAVGFGAPRKQLILFMFISASFWAVVLSSSIYIIGNELTAVIEKYFELPEGLRPQ